MYQEPLTERTPNAHAKAREEAAQRMAAHTILTLRNKNTQHTGKLPVDRTELRRTTPLRGQSPNP